MWQSRMDFLPSSVNKVSMLLQRQLLINLQRIEQIVSSHALKRGWSPPLALQYVTKHMHYQFTDAHEESLELFYTLARSMGIIEEVRPIYLLSS